MGHSPAKGVGVVVDRPAPPTLELARTPGHLIRRAQRVHNVLWVVHVGTEPTGPQFAVLSSVARRPGSDQKTLGRLASLDKSSTTDVVGRLSRHGWLTAAPDEDDRRRKVLHLSTPARAALQALTGKALDVQRELLAPIAESDRAWFVESLSALAYEGDPPGSSTPRPGGLGLELSLTPGHLIRRAQQAYTARWSRAFGGRLTGPQYAVLCAVARHQPLDQLSLGEAASLDKSSTAEVVERLALQGLLSAVADPADRRRKALRLSERAVAELPALTDAAREVQSQLMDLLTPDARTPFLDLLAAVAYQSPVSSVPAGARPGT
jgi:DNA-binding MarR family transcriptional regulator